MWRGRREGSRLPDTPGVRLYANGVLIATLARGEPIVSRGAPFEVRRSRKSRGQVALGGGGEAARAGVALAGQNGGKHENETAKIGLRKCQLI